MIPPISIAALYVDVLVFAFGACLGSFLNVCVHRIPREESVVTPRSHCPHCGQLIPWYDNIPLVSFLVLRARCRHCAGPISARYFSVELLTAVLVLLVWLKYGFDPRTPVYWLLMAGLILGTFVDFEHMIIPDRVTIGGMILGPLFSLLVPVLHGTSDRWQALGSSLVGLGVGFGLLWTVGRLGKMAFKKDAMGFGDVKLLGAVGAFLGWQAVLFVVMVSSLLGSVVGISLILSRRKQWQSRIPYGPYLALAAMLWVLGGADGWYAYLAWLRNPGY
jgi:leader peptidase (prepilin peptidase)/N-methyltransferase